MKNESKKKMQQKDATKRAYVLPSKWLPEVEAYALAKAMRMSDKWYLYKVSENSTAKHIKDRESFVVVRGLSGRGNGKGRRWDFRRKYEITKYSKKKDTRPPIRWAGIFCIKGSKLFLIPHQFYALCPLSGFRVFR
jgi:hypothetical protein